MEKAIINDEYAYFFKRIPSYYNIIEPRIEWREVGSLIMGNIIKHPRLTAHFILQEENIEFISIRPRILMTNQMIKLRQELKDLLHMYQIAPGELDMGVAMKYRDGDDYLGWTTNNDVDVDYDYPVVTATFGVSRELGWRKEDKSEGENSITLHNGDVFVMMPEFKYEYTVPIMADMPLGDMISLTFATRKR